MIFLKMMNKIMMMTTHWQNSISISITFECLARFFPEWNIMFPRAHVIWRLIKENLVIWRLIHMLYIYVMIKLNHVIIWRLIKLNHVHWKIYPLVILLDRTSDFEGGPNVDSGSPSHLQLHHLQGAKRRQNICSRDGRGAKTSENICWQKASLNFGFEMTETGVNHAV